MGKDPSRGSDFLVRPSYGLGDSLSVVILDGISSSGAAEPPVRRRVVKHSLYGVYKQIINLIIRGHSCPKQVFGDRCFGQGNHRQNDIDGLGPLSKASK